MPKNIVSRSIGFAATIGFARTVTGFPHLEHKKAHTLAGAATVFTGEKIIGLITTQSSFKPTPLEDTFLQSSKIIDTNRNLVPPDTNHVSDRITTVLNTVSSLIDSEKNTRCHNANDEEQFNIIYNQFILPFIEQGPIHIGSMQLYNTTIQYFKQIIETNPDVNSVYYMAMNALAAILEARNIYIKTLQQQTEINHISGRYDQAITKIHKLAQKIKDLTGEIDGAFGGSLGMVINPPKPTIYALAILNPVRAWYIYINGDGTIDSQLLVAVQEYVNSLDDPTAELHKLLDEKFKTLAKDLGNIRLTTSSIPCTSSSNKNTSSDSICTTSSDSICTTSSYDSHDSHDSEDSCNFYDNNNSCVNPSFKPGDTVSIWNPHTQKMETAFTLGGNLNISTIPQVSAHSKKNKTCVRRKKRHRHRTTQKHCNPSLMPGDTVSIWNPHTQKMETAFTLGGNLNISTIPQVSAHSKKNKTCVRRKKRHRHRATRKHCNPFATFHPCFGNVLILHGKLDMSINSQFNHNKTRCRRKKYRRCSQKNI